MVTGDRTAGRNSRYGWIGDEMCRMRIRIRMRMGMMMLAMMIMMYT